MNDEHNIEFENTADLRAQVARDATTNNRPVGARLDRDSVQRALREVDQRDATTAAHTWRVVLYTRVLCDAAGVSHEQSERICEGAALHDLGKLDIPIDILQKPGKLTDEEFRIMQEHPVFGHARLVADGVEDPLVLDVVRHHHERYDGKGYPDGLAGLDIPIAARYFAVVDSFDAMTSARPYRSEVGEEAAERAIAELHAGIGTRYFEEAVFHFIDQYRRGNLTWIMRFGNGLDDTIGIPQILSHEQIAEVAEVGEELRDQVP